MSHNRLTIRFRRLIVAEAHGTAGVFTLGLAFGIAAVLIAVGVRGYLRIF
jgi:hypothetical protein